MLHSLKDFAVDRICLQKKLHCQEMEKSVSFVNQLITGSVPYSRDYEAIQLLAVHYNLFNIYNKSFFFILFFFGKRGIEFFFLLH